MTCTRDIVLRTSLLYMSSPKKRKWCLMNRKQMNRKQQLQQEAFLARSIERAERRAIQHEQYFGGGSCEAEEEEEEPR